MLTLLTQPLISSLKLRDCQNNTDIYQPVVMFALQERRLLSAYFTSRVIVFNIHTKLPNNLNCLHIKHLYSQAVFLL